MGDFGTGAADLFTGVDLAVPYSDGHWMTEKIGRITEMIADYDPNIKVQWVPPENREFGDPAFRIMETQPDGRAFVMFYVDTEEHFDEGVLGRIYQLDNAKHGGKVLSAMDARNEAIKAATLKEKMEEMEAGHDLAAHIWKSPKSHYKHDGVIYE